MATTQLAVGTDHSCALRADGTVRCWGYGGWGALGLGNNTNQSSPVLVPSLSNVKQLVSAASSSCAMVGTTVSCWGFNQYGEVGNGTGVNSNVPVAVTRLPAIASLVAGGNLNAP